MVVGVIVTMGVEDTVRLIVRTRVLDVVALEIGETAFEPSLVRQDDMVVVVSQIMGVTRVRRQKSFMTID